MIKYFTQISIFNARLDELFYMLKAREYREWWDTPHITLRATNTPLTEAEQERLHSKPLEDILITGIKLLTIPDNQVIVALNPETDQFDDVLKCDDYPNKNLHISIYKRDAGFLSPLELLDFKPFTVKTDEMHIINEINNINSGLEY